jgi:hypothetical protein
MAIQIAKKNDLRACSIDACAVDISQVVVIFGTDQNCLFAATAQVVDVHGCGIEVQELVAIFIQADLER